MKKKYVAPQTEMSEVELENGFMSSASVFDEENQNDKGLTTEEHGFADPSKEWEGDYGDSSWD